MRERIARLAALALGALLLLACALFAWLRSSGIA
jgi:hypothetical protein